jgi:hypothetical protein
MKEVTLLALCLLILLLVGCKEKEVTFEIPGVWWIDGDGKWHRLAESCEDKVYFVDNSKPLPSMIINQEGATLIGLEPCHPLFSIIEPANKDM